MVESLRTTQIAFFRFATPCGFFRGSADKVQKVSVQGSVQEKLIWNHLWEHPFSVPDPRVFPSPGRPLFDTDDRKPILWLGRTGGPVISLLSFWNRSPEWFKAPSIRIQVESYAVSKIRLDSCARGLKQFKVAFAESSLECPCKPRSQFLPPHSKVHGAHFFISAKKVLQAVVLIMK